MSKLNFARIRAMVLKRDGDRCHYCGQSLPVEILQIDRKLPMSLYPELADDLENMVVACQTCNAKKGSREYSRYLAELYGSSTHALDSFRENLTSTRRLAAAAVDPELQGLQLRLLHANLVTILETYLSDTLLSLVSSRADLRRKVVETSPEFKKRRFDLSEIFSKYDSLDDEVKVYLGDQLYHNLAKVMPMYKAILNVVPPDDLSAIYRAIGDRHDIVHRNGKDKDGKAVRVSVESLEELADELDAFVDHIAAQLPGAV